MPCNQIARYVIVETMYDAPEDSPTTGPILEICEIEVFGKWRLKQTSTHEYALLPFYLRLPPYLVFFDIEMDIMTTNQTLFFNAFLIT